MLTSSFFPVFAAVDPRSANPLLLAILLVWTAILVWRVYRRCDSGSLMFLGGSLLLMWLSREIYMVEVEADWDTSAWLAAALTVGSRSDPFWTLLNYTDSRPLTVLPIVFSQCLGVPLSYINAERVGLVCWIGTIALFYKIFRFHFASSTSVLVCWLLALMIGTTGSSEHIAYNSEHFGVLLLTMATFIAMTLARGSTVNAFAGGALGILLGCLPYEKMQLVPAGLILAGFGVVMFLRRRARAATIAFLIGGVLPTAIVVGWYFVRGESATFWTSYFWRYYYYSMETSEMLLQMRFHPRRVYRFIFGDDWSRFFLLGQTAVIGLGALVLMKRRPHLSLPARSHFLLSALLVATAFYSVLMAGNNYKHYLLLLFVPIMHAAGVVIAATPAAWRTLLIGMGFGAAVLQAGANTWRREPMPPLPTQAADQRLVDVVQKHTRPGESIVTWGYSDRLHLLANRPMGYRYANTYYVYSPLRALKEFDQRLFLNDMKENRPSLFIDAVQPGVYLPGYQVLQHDRFPAVAEYVNVHFEKVASIDDVRIYRRRMPPVAPSPAPMSQEALGAQSSASSGNSASVAGHRKP